MKNSRLFKGGAFILLIVFLLTGAVSSSSDNNNLDSLNADSVILITGVAGFLGSELALALHRTYQPKHIIGIDSMDKGFGPLGPTHPFGGPRTDQELALFEFKRQRIFHVQQTLGDAFTFFRVDLRPSVPDYFDSGEVPVLQHILEQYYADITHVVHFADHYHRGRVTGDEQAVPRIKGQPKAGMMEAVLEQIRLLVEKSNDNNASEQQQRRQPHIVYASSADVYNHRAKQTLTDLETNTQEKLTQKQYHEAPFSEDSPITTPSSMAGTSKLLDEVIAQTYYDLAGIFSIGLRFFSIYGPWGLPGSPIFEMAERVVAGEAPLTGDNNNNNEQVDDIRDYLYIDDAMDAVMSAMQFRPTSSSNNLEPRPLVINIGSGQGTTLRAIGQQMATLVPGSPSVDAAPRSPPTISFASTARAQQLLGFRPIVSLTQGLERLLAWHYDRAFPYGAKPTQASLAAALASKGIAACSPYDEECLNGTPVFPCASECAHETQCTPSFWDDVMEYTKALTSGCHAVLYTVALEDELALLPSTVVRVSENSKPFIVSDDGNCNIAFVSQDSILYRKLSRRSSHQTVQHGFWRLIPVKVTEHARKHQWKVLELLPKLSPGQFFSIACRQAIYADPDVIFHSIPKLLRETALQPYSPQHIRGTTALLIGKRNPKDILETRWNTTRPQDQVQEHSYRMIRLTLMEEMAGDGFAQLLDSSFVVHALAAAEDSRLFRCDVFGEVIQWDASTDRAAFEFIIGLHDMWSRVICKKMGQEPWWIGDDVKTVDQEGNVIRVAPPKPTDSRRLQEELDPPLRRRLQEQDVMTDDGAADDAIVGDAEHNGFGLQDANNLDNLGPRQQQERHETPQDDDFDLGDDWTQKFEAALPLLPKTPRDPSSYDIWMGILSSTSVRSFSRIVSMEAVGALHIENYDELAYGLQPMEL